MTNLNKLFSRYFIITIAIVLVLITLVSNLGASVFFKNFIHKRNEAQNTQIVSTIEEMVNSNLISSAAYPIFFTAISRQEQVDLVLRYDDKIVAYAIAGEVWRRLPGFTQSDTKTVEDPEQFFADRQDNENVEYIDYDIGLFELSIGRVVDPLYNIANANFIKGLNILYILAFAIAMIIAFFAALILSRRFNRPIMQLRDNVNHISMNRFDRIKPCDTKAVEIKELSEDIDGLAVQLQQEEDMRKRLSNDIVHELKTPISVLSTNIEAIMDGVYKADDERMSVLLSQTNRLARLVNNLSDLTLLETETRDDRKALVNLTNVMDSIYTVYLPAATDKNIELVKDFEDNLLLKGNEDRLLQVFVNIMSNSIKYTDDGGRVIMKAYSNGNKIVCEIEDNGIGIDEKDLPFVFNRFYRGDESRSRETGGSGIGLAIAKAIVSSHSGDIKLSSTKNEGTKVTVVFQKS